VPWWTWVALGAFALAVFATAVFAVFALGRLRRLRARAEALARAVEDVERRAEKVERRSAAASERAEDLERARRRLGGSLERLSVLSWALTDARREITRLREAYARK
jgi:predicted RNase H-like nuclease (RuvC/YqgF family)